MEGDLQETEQDAHDVGNGDQDLREGGREGAGGE